MRALGLAGPLMVSTGTPEQLATFLKANPVVPPECAFVDSSPDYDAYSNVGFGKLEFGKPVPDAEGLSLGPPDLGGFGGWMDYFGNVAAVSPKPKEEGQFPEGVKLLGGTVALRGQEVVFASADRVPGDYPAPAAVLERLEALAAATPSEEAELASVPALAT
mmetsp:Transcript_123423/g.360409  ORF Transcript_123423/g.360409 Transcript_123423/m.360409 type:complete len:162 (-) Transcript_123423:180-665(-)